MAAQTQNNQYLTVFNLAIEEELKVRVLRNLVKFYFSAWSWGNEKRKEELLEAIEELMKELKIKRIWYQEWEEWCTGWVHYNEYELSLKDGVLVEWYHGDTTTSYAYRSPEDCSEVDSWIEIYFEYE